MFINSDEHTSEGRNSNPAGPSVQAADEASLCLSEDRDYRFTTSDIYLNFCLESFSSTGKQMTTVKRNLLGKGNE